MQAICCKRCGQEALIPTHQQVKFDLEVQYLCDECWENLRQWFNTGRRSSGKLPRAA